MKKITLFLAAGMAFFAESARAQYVDTSVKWRATCLPTKAWEPMMGFSEDHRSWFSENVFYYEQEVFDGRIFNTRYRRDGRLKFSFCWHTNGNVDIELNQYSIANECKGRCKQTLVTFIPDPVVPGRHDVKKYRETSYYYDSASRAVPDTIRNAISQENMTKLGFVIGKMIDSARGQSDYHH